MKPYTTHSFCPGYVEFQCPSDCRGKGAILGNRDANHCFLQFARHGYRAWLVGRAEALAASRFIGRGASHRYRVRYDSVMSNIIPGNENLAGWQKLLYLCRMPNSPGADTVTVSFTMPRELAAVVQQLARRRLTNKSDIIRQALLAYIPPKEADEIMRAMGVTVDGPADAPPASPKQKKPRK